MIRKAPFFCLTIVLSTLFSYQVAQGAFISVNQGGDGGSGSFREALIKANASTEPSEIIFEIPESDPSFSKEKTKYTILIESPLPELISLFPITINGQGKVILDGSRGVGRFEGLILGSSSHDISGLTIQNFSGGGLLIHGEERRPVQGIKIHDNRFLDNGVLSEGAFSGDGVRLAINVSGCHIFDNLIARNKGEGLSLESLTSAVWQNYIFGNFITGNEKNGVKLQGSRNILGQKPDRVPAPNVIAQNHLSGISLQGDFAHGNIISYDRIGLGPDGNLLGNKRDGISLSGGAKNNQIGPSLKIYDNDNGVIIKDLESRGNQVTENEITQNRNHGIWLQNIAETPVTLLEKNFIKQNLSDGILIQGASPALESNDIASNEGFGVEVLAQEMTQNKILEKDTLQYSIPTLRNNHIARNLKGGLYALDTIFKGWEKIEKDNEFIKNTDFDVLVEWYQAFGFDLRTQDFGVLKVEIKNCHLDHSPCRGNEIRESETQFFIGPKENFNLENRETFFRVTQFFVKDGQRQDLSPQKVILSGDEEREYYLRYQERIAKILQTPLDQELKAQSVDDSLAPRSLHLMNLGTFGKRLPNGFWTWSFLSLLTLFFLYHFWLAGHKMRKKESFLSKKSL